VRLQIWARQWRAAKLAPKVYGDQVHHDVSGEIVHMTAEQRRARIAELTAKLLASAGPPTIEGDAEGKD
jgi:hypothetical protein